MHRVSATCKIGPMEKMLNNNLRHNHRGRIQPVPRGIRVGE
ncbi:hypothetical protein SAMN05444321_7672 [Bradyrhizobium lablabi]|nr:hypothetical protein SAMN05444321_7672 [Bradyrhizobium lablabi]